MFRADCNAFVDADAVEALRLRVLEELLQVIAQQRSKPNALFTHIVAVLTQLKDVTHARRNWGVFPADVVPQLFREVVLFEF